MQNYGVTSLIGGVTPGTHSTDIFYMNHAGELIPNTCNGDAQDLLTHAPCS